ncbi:hypothetical protein LPJ61_005860 [Coemansia biformis]|uniref:Uncharacterized protein n=1 Tax=Coemansia biformis TaxID=1286918 RepID=A0A9W7Y2N3_9FUNG|nr:hypothetical protein LPJ61_005860 [Coemansia biformis]
MYSIHTLVALAFLALMQIANAIRLDLSNVTNRANYDFPDSKSCHNPPAFYEGEFNQAGYINDMFYLYPTYDCTGFRTVVSKSTNLWANVYHPIRSVRIMKVNY